MSKINSEQNFLAEKNYEEVRHKIENLKPNVYKPVKRKHERRYYPLKIFEIKKRYSRKVPNIKKNKIK